eukprot:m.298073 g.298073  ORF g.298073 m.298073 type:complete len:1082 (-) comp16407_c0_seq13:503-3748(-)
MWLRYSVGVAVLICTIYKVEAEHCSVDAATAASIGCAAVNASCTAFSLEGADALQDADYGVLAPCLDLLVAVDGLFAASFDASVNVDLSHLRSTMGAVRILFKGCSSDGGANVTVGGGKNTEDTPALDIDGMLQISLYGTCHVNSLVIPNVARIQHKLLINVQDSSAIGSIYMDSTESGGFVVLAGMSLNIVHSTSSVGTVNIKNIRMIGQFRNSNSGFSADIAGSLESVLMEGPTSGLGMEIGGAGVSVISSGTDNSTKIGFVVFRNVYTIHGKVELHTAETTGFMAGLGIAGNQASGLRISGSVVSNISAECLQKQERPFAPGVFKRQKQTGPRLMLYGVENIDEGVNVKVAENACISQVYIRRAIKDSDTVIASSMNVTSIGNCIISAEGQVGPVTIEDIRTVGDVSLSVQGRIDSVNIPHVEAIGKIVTSGQGTLGVITAGSGSLDTVNGSFVLGNAYIEGDAIINGSRNMTIEGDVTVYSQSTANTSVFIPRISRIARSVMLPQQGRVPQISINTEMGKKIELMIGGSVLIGSMNASAGPIVGNLVKTSPLATSFVGGTQILGVSDIGGGLEIVSNVQLNSGTSSALPSVVIESANGFRIGGRFRAAAVGAVSQPSYSQLVVINGLMNIGNAATSIVYRENGDQFRSFTINSREVEAAAFPTASMAVAGNTMCLNSCRGRGFLDKFLSTCSDAQCICFDRETFGKKCQKQARVCQVSEFQTAPPTSSSNRMCQTLKECTTGEFMKQDATRKSDYVCETCPNGQFQPNNTTKDQSCETWSQECSSDAFEFQIATGSTDRVCQNTTTCKSYEYEETEPTVSSDRVCSLCSDRRSAYKPGFDEPCLPVSNCSVGQYMRIEATVSTDRICSYCPRGTFQNAKAHSYSQCKPYTRSCEPGSFISNEPINRERMCSQCPVGKYQTKYNESECIDWSTSCNSDEFEIVNPTTLRDRVCKPKRSCEAGELLVISSSSSDDPDAFTCRPCPTGTYQNATFHTSEECIPFTTSSESCSKGEYMASPGSTTTDRLCLLCPEMAVLQATEPIGTRGYLLGDSAIEACRKDSVMRKNAKRRTMISQLFV